MKYTAGELAKKLDVSARTVRFYDEKGILLPCEYSESGYRLYDDQSAEQLQKILLLRFLDFSIDQIRTIMQETKPGEKFDVQQSLREQERILKEKQEHMERILQAVKRAQMADEEHLWENLMEIIHITKERENVIDQYRKDDNLNQRISIHEYSTAKEGFYSWLLRQQDFHEGMKILEIGCGNAAFYKSVASMLPNNLEVHLTDYSVGMLESAEKVVHQIEKEYPEKGLKFILEKRDATEFSYPFYGFDRIIANNVLFYVNKESRKKLYQTIQRLLSPKGRFSCTLIGNHHLQELHQLVRKHYPKIHIPSDSFDLWFENAPKELEEFFSQVSSMEQKNDLLVPDEEIVFHYVCSYSEEAKEILKKDKEHFLQLVREQMNADGYLFIHKSTGIVVCSK
ncbi:MAG: MerR family transcriptional regulator [Clostridiales bacterium]|nr:MerR family transcriptional regulator [Clostridiales bacterium]